MNHVAQIPRLIRMVKSVLWLIVSNTAEGLRMMRTDDSMNALAAHNFSMTVKRAVSVECVTLKPDWLGPCRWFCDRDRP